MHQPKNNHCCLQVRVDGQHILREFCVVNNLKFKLFIEFLIMKTSQFGNRFGGDVLLVDLQNSTQGVEGGQCLVSAQKILFVHICSSQMSRF